MWFQQPVSSGMRPRPPAEVFERSSVIRYIRLESVSEGIYTWSFQDRIAIRSEKSHEVTRCKLGLQVYGAPIRRVFVSSADWSVCDIKVQWEPQRADAPDAFESLSRYFEVIHWSFCSAASSWTHIITRVHKHQWFTASSRVTVITLVTTVQPTVC